jgi:predicted SnoaL-like aldol condensation-catalyzing enzyme
MASTNHKQVALDFLRFAQEGNRVGAEQLAAPGARHHNPYFSARMPALLDAIVAAAAVSPQRETDVKRVICEGDYVVTHSHIRQRPGDLGAAVVHIFRFQGDHIAELWDLGQAVPSDNPNTAREPKALLR